MFVTVLITVSSSKELHSCELGEGWVQTAGQCKTKELFESKS